MSVIIARNSLFSALIRNFKCHESPIHFRSRLVISRLKVILLYFAMLPLEVYGRCRGVYKPRFHVRSKNVINSPAEHAGPVVCFGDSLTAGYGALPGLSYPDLLQKALDPTRIPVVNAGRNGDTAADGLARLHSDVLSLNPPPRAVIIGFGGNDLMQRLPPAETFAHLEAMIRQVQGVGAVAVLLGLRGSWLYNVDYETPFFHLAEKTGAALVPLCLDGIWGYPWLMSDPAHPNARGYAELARRVHVVLLPHLGVLAPPTRP